jgi:hypothetical protein
LDHGVPRTPLVSQWVDDPVVMGVHGVSTARFDTLY